MPLPVNGTRYLAFGGLEDLAWLNPRTLALSINENIIIYIQQGEPCEGGGSLVLI